MTSKIVEMDYNNEIEKTINSLGGMSKAKAPKFFYDDVLNKIDESKEVAFFPPSILKIAAVILLLLNLSLIVPAGIIDFSIQSTSTELNEEYFSANSSIYSYDEFSENEEL